FANLLVKDPTTGVTTNIFTGDVGKDIFKDKFSDDFSDKFYVSPSGGRTETYADTEKEYASKTFSHHGPIDISIVGSPQPGLTVDYRPRLNVDNSGSNTITGDDISAAKGSDAGTIKFQDIADVSVGG